MKLHLFCPSSSAWQSEGFVKWLSSQGKTRWTIKQTKNYAIKYGHILDTGDASELLTARYSRHNVLSALSNLAKYQGRYQIFQEIRQCYALKWTSRNNSLQTLQRFFNPDLTLDIKLQRIHEMIRLLPTFMGKIIKFGCLVGLRPAEVVESVKLINDKEAFPKYYDYDKITLCHYKFPVFLRTTKKAYVSFVTPSMLKLAFGIPNDISYNAIRLSCQRKRIKCEMRFTRKVYGSWLHQSGIASENIDFLQGRVNPSVFSRHYLTPSQDLKGKVIEALEKLQQQLD